MAASATIPAYTGAKGLSPRPTSKTFRCRSRPTSRTVVVRSRFAIAPGRMTVTGSPCSAASVQSTRSDSTLLRVYASQIQRFCPIVSSIVAPPRRDGRRRFLVELMCKNRKTFAAKRRLPKVPGRIDATGLKLAPRAPIPHLRGGVVDHLDALSRPARPASIRSPRTTSTPSVSRNRVSFPGRTRRTRRPSSDEALGDVATEHPRGSRHQVACFVPRYVHDKILGSSARESARLSLWLTNRREREHTWR